MRHHQKNLHVEFDKPIGTFHVLDPDLKCMLRHNTGIPIKFNINDQQINEKQRP